MYEHAVSILILILVFALLSFLGFAIGWLVRDKKHRESFIIWGSSLQFKARTPAWSSREDGGFFSAKFNSLLEKMKLLEVVSKEDKETILRLDTDLVVREAEMFELENNLLETSDKLAVVTRELAQRNQIIQTLEAMMGKQVQSISLAKIEGVAMLNGSDEPDLFFEPETNFNHTAVNGKVLFHETAAGGNSSDELETNNNLFHETETEISDISFNKPEISGNLFYESDAELTDNPFHDELQISETLFHENEVEDLLQAFSKHVADEGSMFMDFGETPDYASEFTSFSTLPADDVFGDLIDFTPEHATDLPSVDNRIAAMNEGFENDSPDEFENRDLRISTREFVSPHLCFRGYEATIVLVDKPALKNVTPPNGKPDADLGLDELFNQPSVVKFRQMSVWASQARNMKPPSKRKRKTPVKIKLADEWREVMVKAVDKAIARN